MTADPGSERPLLPEQTGDDTDAGWGEPVDAGDVCGRDAWLLAERPPHWD